MHYWGIDLGGTKIEVAVLQGKNSTQTLARERTPTEQTGGYEHILNNIKTLVDRVARQVGSYPDQIGMAHPGTLDPRTQLLKNSNTLVLNDQPVKKDLETLLGIPVVMANDANCFAIAETRLGAVQKVLPDAEVVFGVILGTGVGGGLVVHQKVIQGRHGIAGEWGHNFLDASGGPCYCGQEGCIETILSGPGLERYYEQRTGQKRALKEMMRSEEKAARQTRQRLFHYFGKAIATIVNILDPDAIVLGGGLGNIDRLYTDGVAEAGKYIFNPRLETTFLRPALGDSAGVFGAAMLLQ